MENSIFIQQLGMGIYELANAEGRLKSYPDFHFQLHSVDSPNLSVVLGSTLLPSLTFYFEVGVRSL